MEQKLLGIAIIFGSIFLAFVAYTAVAAGQYLLPQLARIAAALRLSVVTFGYASGFLGFTLLMFGLYVLWLSRS